MKAFTQLFSAVAIALALGASLTAWAVEVGQVAPDFTLQDLSGVSRSLSDYRGKTIVLEWVNPECPFVQKHYDHSGNIPKIQKNATADGTIWLSINSAAPGKDGDYDPAAAKAWQERVHSNATDYFRDRNGKVGKLYDARTTPHLFIIDPKGVLVYEGGIDSIRSTRVEDIAKATNYVTGALADLREGRPVQHPTSRPYGCSVKY
jgi:glutathione peroxidase-family protein